MKIIPAKNRKNNKVGLGYWQEQSFVWVMEPKFDCIEQRFQYKYAIAYNSINRADTKRDYFLIDKELNISEKHELTYNITINGKVFYCYSDDVEVIQDPDGKMFGPKESWLYQPEQYSDPELIEFAVLLENKNFWNIFLFSFVPAIIPDFLKIKATEHFRKFLEHEFKKRGLSFIFE